LIYWQDGAFYGKSVVEGASASFALGLAGYQEIFTDPLFKFNY
jgi:carbamoylphosphate synthase small subunit